MKKDYSMNRNISISLKKFQQRIDETRFSGVTIKEILEQYFGGKIISNKEQKKKEQQDLQCFLEDIKQCCKYSKTKGLLDKALMENTDELSRIKKEYYKDKQNMEKELKKVITAIENLPKQQESLPIFASKINVDPHSLDRNKLAGQIFLKLLIMAENELDMTKENNNNEEQYIEDIEQKQQAKQSGIITKRKPKTTEEIAEIYYNNNILIDEMSNMVLIRNLIAFKDGHAHKGWEPFSNRHEAMQVTLYNLS